MTTLTIEETGIVDKDKLDRFLETLLWEKSVLNKQGQPIGLYRLKVSYLCNAVKLHTALNTVLMSFLGSNKHLN